MLKRGISLLTQRNTADDDVGVGRSEGSSGCGEVKRERYESPPDDDVCAICFGDFCVPCKTNCGHWFCGSCIMQFWHYKATIKRCKCPICSRLISVLIPEACLLGRQEKEVVDVLQNVHRYNCLFQGGFGGLLQLLNSSAGSFFPLVFFVRYTRCIPGF